MKLSLNQIDIDKISNLIVERKKLVYKYGEEASSDNSADDTDFVDNILSKYAAIAADENDRYTVENAERLDGRPASEFLSTVQSKDVKTNIGKMKLAFGNDINDIANELHILKNSVLESGFIKNRFLYSGLVDPLKDGKDFMVSRMKTFGDCSQGNNNILKVRSLNGYNQFSKYQFVCITNPANQKFDIRQIIDLNGGNREFVLDSPVSPDVVSTQAEITKTKGFVYHGSFNFANKIEMQADKNDMYSGLSDDTYRTTKKINESNHGFGYSFRVPENKQGFISSFEICAKAHGKPGELICYIIDERDLYKFRNPNQAYHDAELYKVYGDETGFRFFMKSKPELLEEDQGIKYIKFDFKKVDGSFPMPTTDSINHSTRYVAIVKAFDVDSENYYDIVFVQHKNGETLGDLEVNNKTYYYEEKSMDSHSPALQQIKNEPDSDLYYNIVTRKIIDSRPDPVRKGLYTTHLEFDANKNRNGAEKLRVILRIRREGILYAETDKKEPVLYTDQPIGIRTEGFDNIEDAKLTSLVYKAYQNRTSKNDNFEHVKAALGKNIINVEGVNSRTITTKKPVLVNDNDKLYRIGYIVSVTARRITPEKNGVIDMSDAETLILPLREIFKSSSVNDRHSVSDDLLFETEIEDAYKKKYNDFEIQVYWENREMSDYEGRKMSSMGAIDSITFSALNSRALSADIVNKETK